MGWCGQRALRHRVAGFIALLMTVPVVGPQPAKRTVPAKGAAPSEIDVTDCTWSPSAQYDGRSTGYAGIDRNAFYALAYPPTRVPGAHFRFRGQFPNARYFGFQSYDDTTLPVDVLPDRDMVPDAGSVNPFARHRWAEGHGAYTIDLRDIPAAARPRRRPANTLYGGYSRDTRTTYRDQIEYRIYVPDRQRSGPGIMPGDVPLPRALFVLDDPAKAPWHTHDEVCRGSTTGFTFRALGFADRIFQLIDPVWRASQLPPAPAQNPPAWFGAAAGSRFAYLNQETGYLISFISEAYGEVLVLRFRVPTFPDTEAKAALTSQTQVRYWSICTIQTVSLTYADACLRDHEFRPDAGGFVTVVLSDPSHRPAADPRRPFGWLPYPGGSPFLFVRQIDADPATFAQSAAFLTAGLINDAAVRRHMGSYYPGGVYCSQRRFEVDRCGLAGGRVTQ